MYRTELADCQAYQACLQEADDTTLFHSMEWLKTIEEGFALRIVFLGTRFSSSDEIVVTPYMVQRKGPILLYGSPLQGTFTPYMGPVWPGIMDSNTQNSIIRSQCDFLRKMGAHYIEFSFCQHGFHGLTESFLSQKWRRAAVETLVLTLDDHSTDQLWRGMQSRGRNMVRKAEKNSVVIKRMEGTEGDVDAFYSMLEVTFAKSQSSPPHPKRFYGALMKNLIPGKMLLFLSAEWEGRLVAMGLFPYDHNEIHYLSGASVPEANKVAANNLIQWEVIKFAVEKGIKNYDLGGIGIPSIDRFKRSFGAQPTYYEHDIWMAPWLHPIYNAYLKTRPLLQRLHFALGKR